MGRLPWAARVGITALLIVQLTGCGTLLYPERRGQKAGHMDVGVVVLDAIGLLFFLIPGIIAFAVDFSTGCIYLPATAVNSSGHKELKQVKFDPKHTTVADLERIIEQETGREVKLTAEQVQVSPLKSVEDIRRVL